MKSIALALLVIFAVGTRSYSVPGPVSEGCESGLPYLEEVVAEDVSLDKGVVDIRTG